MRERLTGVRASIKPRPGKWRVRQFELTPSSVWYHDPAGDLRSRDTGVTFATAFESGDRIEVVPTDSYERVVRPFPIAATQVRVNYIFRTIDNVFIVYNETRYTEGVFDGRANKSLVVKATYFFPPPLTKLSVQSRPISPIINGLHDVFDPCKLIFSP